MVDDRRIHPPKVAPHRCEAVRKSFYTGSPEGGMSATTEAGWGSQEIPTGS